MRLLTKFADTYTKFVLSKIPHRWRKSNVFFFALMALALPTTIYLGQQILDIRQRASEVVTPVTPPDPILSPTITQHKYSWDTPFARISADAMYLEYNGQKYEVDPTKITANSVQNHPLFIHLTFNSTQYQLPIKTTVEFEKHVSNNYWNIRQLYTYVGNRRYPNFYRQLKVQAPISEPFTSHVLTIADLPCPSVKCSLHIGNLSIQPLFPGISPQPTKICPPIPTPPQCNGKLQKIYADPGPNGPFCEKISYQCLTNTPTPPKCVSPSLTSSVPTESCDEGNYRYVKYTCSDGFTGVSGTSSSCKPPALWKTYATQLCVSRKSCVSPTKTKTPTPTTVSYNCDVNGDKAVNTNDYTRLLECYIKSPSCTTADKQRSDINKDGKLDLVDYNYYQKYCRNVTPTRVTSPTISVCAVPQQVQNVNIEFPGCDNNNECDFRRASCSWSTQQYASSYIVKVSNVASSGSVYNSQVAGSTSKVLFPVTNGGTYRCEVSAVNACSQAGIPGVDQLKTEVEGLTPAP